jgi:microcompartment protein CcmL/EutN
VPPGPLGIDPGRRLWVAFLDTPDGLLAVMVGGSVAEWQAALDAAEPVLESVRIGS